MGDAELPSRPATSRQEGGACSQLTGRGWTCGTAILVGFLWLAKPASRPAFCRQENCHQLFPACSAA
eukprot:2409986-Lingulodinium_polyedra.AAC.1